MRLKVHVDSLFTCYVVVRKEFFQTGLEENYFLPNAYSGKMGPKIRFASKSIAMVACFLIILRTCQQGEFSIYVGLVYFYVPMLSSLTYCAYRAHN
jgi:hypothetical protein